MRTIDLRSDTVTKPTREMLESIMAAPLGDDVEKEDETVNRLQEKAARMFGAGSALLMPSGTQGNLVAMLTHCRRGDEIILESEAHMYYYEVGGMSALVGAIPRLIKGERGVFTAEEVEAAIRPYDPLHYPPSTLLEIENTHNRAGGCCWTPDQVASVSKVATDHGLKVHIDGARIFNAAIALDVSVREFMRHVDSMSFCLSKGLCCPVGSVLLGSDDFIERARANRKMVGGGMRQAGIIAAPGIVALDKMVHRLKEDHDNAAMLARGLQDIDGIEIDMRTVQTNIVIANVKGTGMSSDGFVEMCARNGIRIFSFGPETVRFVTHHGIEKEDIEETVARIERALS
ncbi:MAG: low-specificity L-threonine aldolase [Methanomassiliicoccales archaeon]|nr:MAG: low-specificity L-threonine aldolase [Methanomassiliicoccales archaeon]